MGGEVDRANLVYHLSFTFQITATVKCIFGLVNS